MGFWGGVNINIAVSVVIQLYPNASPGNLLRKFFLVFKSWRWPNPVMLCKPHDAELGLHVWSAFHAANARQVAPIITPAYPAMNSTLAVSRQTLQILHEEFCRGHDVVDKIWKESLRSTDNSFNSDGEMFAELFKPSDFFISYPHYLSICIVGPSQEAVQSWAGFVESRLRRLVSDLLGKLPVSKIQLWPKKFEACCVSSEFCGYFRLDIFNAGPSTNPIACNFHDAIEAAASVSALNMELENVANVLVQIDHLLREQVVCKTLGNI